MLFPSLERAEPQRVGGERALVEEVIKPSASFGAEAVVIFLGGADVDLIDVFRFYVGIALVVAVGDPILLFSQGRPRGAVSRRSRGWCCALALLQSSLQEV